MCFSSQERERVICICMQVQQPRLVLAEYCIKSVVLLSFRLLYTLLSYRPITVQSGMTTRSVSPNSVSIIMSCLCHHYHRIGLLLEVSELFQILFWLQLLRRCLNEGSRKKSICSHPRVMEKRGLMLPPILTCLNRGDKVPEIPDNLHTPDMRVTPS